MQFNKNTFLLLFITLSSVVAQAQEIFKYQGKSYLIYPYRMEYNNSEKVDVPFYPGELKDGEYVVLFAMPKSYSYPPNDKGTNSHPACIFNIVDGKKEGKALFFANKLKKDNTPLVMLKGQYQNGMKQGNWYYYNYSIYGIVRDSMVVPYDKNLKSGTQVSWEHDGYTSTTEYKNGLRDGFQRVMGRCYHYTRDTLNGWQYDTTYGRPFRVYMNQGKRGDTLYLLKENNSKSIRIVVLDESLSEKAIQDSGNYYVEIMDESPKSLLYYINESDLKQGFGYYSSNQQGIYGKIETFDTFNNLLETQYFINNALRVNALKKKIEFSEIRSTKPKTKKYETVSMGRRKLYRIKEDCQYENKRISQHPILGDIYQEEWKEENGAMLLQQYFVKNYSKVLIFKRKLGSFDSDNREIKEINSTWADSIEEYTHWYYLLGNEALPDYFLRYKVLSKRNYRSLRNEYYTISYPGKSYFNVVSTTKSDDSILNLLNGRGGISRYNDSMLIIQNLEFKGGENSFAAVWSDTVRFYPLSRNESSMKSYLDYLEFHSEINGISSYFGTANLPQRMPKFYINYIPFDGNLYIYHGDADKMSKKPNELVTWKYFQTKSAFVYLEDNSYGRGGWEEGGYYNSYYLTDLLNINVNEGLADGKVELELDAYKFKRKNLRRIKRKYYSDFDNVTAFYNQGLVNGEVSILRNQKRLKLNYKEGKQFGLQFENSIANRDYVYNHEEIYSSSVYLNSNGELDGMSNIAMADDIYVNLGLQNGKPNGPYLVYYNNQLVDSGTFSDGIMLGTYKSWYFDRDLNTTIVTFEGTLENNCLKDTVKTYFEDGRPSCILALKDSVEAIQVLIGNKSISLYGIVNSNSVYYSSNSTYIRQIRDSSRMDDEEYANNSIYFDKRLEIECSTDGIGGKQDERLIDFSPDWDGHYTYLYKSGLKSQEGTVVNGLRSGIWKFYNEAGFVFKEIDYKSDSTMNPYDNSKKIHYKGICKGYNNFGKPIYEGFILDENFSYACATQGAISIQEVFYTHIFDSMGKDILKSNIHIPVVDYQISGAKLFDGFWYNGQRDSLWKFYNAGGNPESIGMYSMGKRDGRWIKGDLSGVNFIDNACFKVEDSYVIDQLRKELEFTELLYDMGTVLESHVTEVQTDGFTQSYGWSGFSEVLNMPWHWGKRKKQEFMYDYYKSSSSYRSRHYNRRRHYNF